jgi:polar amino acid transport system substrate-binding protein
MCEREIQAPVSPTGLSITVQDDKIGGIYKDLLDSVASKSNCTFAMSAVPRARLERLFEAGKADLMLAVTRSPERDRIGSFIPLLRTRAMAMGFGGADRKPMTRSTDLVRQSSIRLVIVRGFNLGPAYLSLVEAMQKEGRLIQETDPQAVARWLRANPNDVTLMAPITLYGALVEDERLKDLVDSLYIDDLDDIPWVDTGVYLSRTAIPAKTLKFLQTAIQKETRNDYLHKRFTATFPAHILKGSVMPIPR